MYNVIVVDDEEMIRKGIIKVIHWEKLGVGQIFEAASGESAIDIINHNKIDILITDICMSGMNGLTLVSKINETNKDIRIIVLTGYDTFEYAQRCCKMNVYDYIMKPVDEDELEKVIGKIILELEHENENIENEKIKTRALGLKEQIYIDQIMNGILMNKIDREKIQRLLLQYKYFDDKPIQVAVLKTILDDNKIWKQYYELMNLNIKNSCVEMFDYRHEGITFEDYNKNIVIVVFADKHFKEISDRVGVLIKYIEAEYNIKQKVILGSIVHNIYEMKISYNDSIENIQNIDDVSLIIQNKKVKNNMESYREVFNRIEKNIIDKMNDVDKIILELNKFNAIAEAYNLSVSMLKKSCFELASTVYYEHCMDTNDFNNKNINSLMVSLQACEREESFDLLRKFILDLLYEDKSENNEIVKNAKIYVREHLKDDISVNDIAASMFINTNYFSRLFKKITGEGCNNYITRKRLEKAKLLLEATNIKIGNIASAVGYKDTNYFSLTFKKQTGLSPKEFREKRYMNK
ncbi:MAG TPA: DNA-binding response regulator [Clostridium sp.]|nr:DNA-binding response regulator [Clostridium sp.]